MATRVDWNGAAVEAVVDAASGAGAASAARGLLRMAKPRTPRDTGLMADSGTYVMVDGRAIVGFLRPGKDGEVITRRQHEDLSLRHPNGGEPKWLERSVDEYRSAAMIEMAVAVRRVL